MQYLFFVVFAAVASRYDYTISLYSNNLSLHIPQFLTWRINGSYNF